MFLCSMTVQFQIKRSFNNKSLCCMDRLRRSSNIGNYFKLVINLQQFIILVKRGLSFAINDPQRCQHPHPATTYMHPPTHAPTYPRTNAPTHPRLQLRTRPCLPTHQPTSPASHEKKNQSVYVACDKLISQPSV